MGLLLPHPFQTLPRKSSAPSPLPLPPQPGTHGAGRGSGAPLACQDPEVSTSFPEKESEPKDVTHCSSFLRASLFLEGCVLPFEV